MKLTGDQNIDDMPLKTSEVNHLRQLLAWMSCEYSLDADMQRGYLKGAQAAVTLGIACEQAASELIQQKADEINRVPAYIRQAHKMLTKALKKHEVSSGVLTISAPENG
jgi:hypothetical protein